MKTSLSRLVFFTLSAFSVALLVLVAMGKSPMPSLDAAINQLPITLTSAVGLRSSEPVVVGDWPPVKGQRYPDLILADQNGDAFRLSDLKGKIILLELAAVPCGGCQAFAGAHEFGVFRADHLQDNLGSIHRYAKEFANVDLGHDHDVVLVQLLLYGMSMTGPTQEEVSGWAEHFHMRRDKNEIVLKGDASMLSRDTYNLIPGFHLIDRDFILRSDSAGHQPIDDLYRQLLPELGKLARKSRR